MDDYTGDDVAFDVLAGIFSEQERIRAEQGEDAWLEKVYDDVMLVGALTIDLEKAGYTDAEIMAEIHMRMYTGQGFTHISFGNDCAGD